MECAAFLQELKRCIYENEDDDEFTMMQNTM